MFPDLKNLLAFFQLIEKFKDFSKSPSFETENSQVISGLLLDIQNNKDTRILAEKIGLFLEERFYKLGVQMKGNEDDYENILFEVVKSIENILSGTINVWKDRVIYFREVEEVWIACEPMLDLIDNEDGGFDLLERQLLHVRRIKYFLTSKIYYDDLVSTLQRRGLDTSKVEFVKIREKLSVPIVIYIRKDGKKHGMLGKNFPEIKKNDNGGYSFTSRLDTDWLSYIKPKSIEKYHADIISKIKQEL